MKLSPKEMHRDKQLRTRRTALLLVYSHRRQGFSRAKTLKFWPALPSASGLPPGMRLSFLLGTSAGAGALKLMLLRAEDVCRTADCTCRSTRAIVMSAQRYIKYYCKGILAWTGRLTCVEEAMQNSTVSRVIHRA